MSTKKIYEVSARSPQAQLEDARSRLPRGRFKEQQHIKVPIVLGVTKRWQEDARYFRKEIAPEGRTGQVESIYSLNKDKQKILQFQHSPSRQLQGRLRARARQAEAKETADKALAKRRLQRVSLEKGKAGAASAPERDWMAELERGAPSQEGFLVGPADSGQDLSWTHLFHEAEPTWALDCRRSSDASDAHAQPDT
jgi:hypothetical protein